jgi:hypothetical protein
VTNTQYRVLVTGSTKGAPYHLRGGVSQSECLGHWRQERCAERRGTQFCSCQTSSSRPQDRLLRRMARRANIHCAGWTQLGVNCKPIGHEALPSDDSLRHWTSLAA